MSTATLEATGESLQPAYSPQTIVDSLPTGPYQNHYQPDYADPSAVAAAIARVQETSKVTTPERIIYTKQVLARVAISGFIVLTGSCATPVLYGEADTVAARSDFIDNLAVGMEATREAVETSELAEAFRLDGGEIVVAERDIEQAVKPRSSATQKVTEKDRTSSTPAGTVVTSFLGEGVNGMSVDERAVNPVRMVAMAEQAHLLERSVTEQRGHHPITAHEALLLASELAQVYVDNQGKHYLLSADVPWIGARTNDPTGPHAEFLSTTENAVGVKISDKSDPEHIRAIAEKLNPKSEEGKLIFMMRVGGSNLERLDKVLAGIREHAPNAIIMYDIHGVTKTNKHGEKIRAESEIIDEIVQLIEACNKHNLRMSGVHLETVGDSDRNECVADPNQRPTDEGYVDPRLNPQQLQRILNAIADAVLRQNKRLRELKAELN